MHNHPIAGTISGKPNNPSAVTCPNCGHRMGLLRKKVHSSRRAADPTKRRTRVRSSLLVLRGSLLWFACVFVLVGILAGAAGQSMLPTVFGVVLLAVHGFTYLFAAR
jgi:hypothetical protein